MAIRHAGPTAAAGSRDPAAAAGFLGAAAGRSDAAARSAPAGDPVQPASAERMLRRLEWTVIRRLDGLLHGDYRTLFRGSGLDLADLREYQHHDDVRHIDWNVTARLNTPYVRQFSEDREVSAWFLLDLSPSMDFGSTGLTKRQAAAELVGVLARLLTRHGNRVGAVFYGAGVEAVIPAGSGRAQVLQVLHRMIARPVREEAPPTDLGPLLQAAAQAMRRRCLAFVVSDFVSAPGWERPLAQLAQRHELTAIRLLDPLEYRLPDLGIVAMRDAETGEQLLVDTHDARFRARFEAAAQRRDERLREALATAGVDALELSTEDDLLDALVRFAELRRARSRLAAGATAPVPLGGMR